MNLIPLEFRRSLNQTVEVLRARIGAWEDNFFRQVDEYTQEEWVTVNRRLSEKYAENFKPMSKPMAKAMAVVFSLPAAVGEIGRGLANNKLLRVAGLASIALGVGLGIYDTIADHSVGAQALINPHDGHASDHDIGGESGVFNASDYGPVMASMKSNDGATTNFYGDAEPKLQAAGNPFFGPELGLKQLHKVGPLEDGDNVNGIGARVVSELLPAMKDAGVDVIDSNGIYVVNAHREGPILANDERRPYADIDGQVAIVFDANGNPYLASKLGGDFGSVAMVPEYSGDWHVNALSAEQVTEGGANIIVFKALGSANASGDLVVRNAMQIEMVNGEAVLYMLVPDGKGVIKKWALNEPVAVDEKLKNASPAKVLASLLSQRGSGGDIDNGQDESVAPELTPEELATMDKIEKIIFTDPVENVSVGGVTITGAFGVAESAVQAGVGELTMPDKLGGEILSEAVFSLYFYHGPNPHAATDVPTEQDRADFLNIWSEVQSGERPCSDIQVKPFAFDAKVAGTDQTQMPLEIMCGDGAPSAGARQIDSIEIQIVKAYGDANEELRIFEKDPDYPRVVLTGKNSMGDGYETEIDGRVLRIKVGLKWKLNNPSLNVAMLIANMIDWLRVNNGNAVQSLTQDNRDVNKGEKWIQAGFELKGNN